MAENWGKRREIKSAGSGGAKFMALDFSAYDVEQFKLKLGNNRIEILPFTVTSKMHPLVAEGKLAKGDLDYNVIVKTHNNIGPSKKSVVCPSMYGKACPICEAAEAAKKAGDEKTNEALYAKKKVYYNVIDNSERDKGVKIFESNIKYFQKPLEVADANCEEDFPGKFFADINKGLTVKILGGEETFNNNKFIQASSITFVERKEGVKEFADKVIPLDQCIKLLSYEELENLMMGVGVAEDEEEDGVDTPPAKKVSKPSAEEDDTPTPKKVTAEATPDTECPNGFPWGDAVNGDHGECDECPGKLYARCAKSAKK